MPDSTGEIESKHRDALMDEMLRRWPGRSFTQQEIADYCGMSQQHLDRIERRARWKLRQVLQESNCAIISILEGTDGE